jgi:hypothetical protein
MGIALGTLVLAGLIPAIILLVGRFRAPDSRARYQILGYSVWFISGVGLAALSIQGYHFDVDRQTEAELSPGSSSESRAESLNQIGPSEEAVIYITAARPDHVTPAAELAPPASPPAPEPASAPAAAQEPLSPPRVDWLRVCTRGPHAVPVSTGDTIQTGGRCPSGWMFVRDELHEQQSPAPPTAPAVPAPTALLEPPSVNWPSPPPLPPPARKARREPSAPPSYLRICTRMIAGHRDTIRTMNFCPTEYEFVRDIPLKLTPSAAATTAASPPPAEPPADPNTDVHLGVPGAP